VDDTLKAINPIREAAYKVKDQIQEELLELESSILDRLIVLDGGATELSLLQLHQAR